MIESTNSFNPNEPAPPGGVVASVAFEHIFSEAQGEVFAGLIRLLGDFDLAEEALQDAWVEAVRHWPLDGVPTRPGAWLFQTARRKAIDRGRREQRRHEKHASAARFVQQRQDDEHDAHAHPTDDSPVTDALVADDQLRLIFTCCHPALAREAQIALTLRTLGGLTTNEIARAFLVPEATMAQRLVRAKTKMRLAGIPYRVPAAPELPERLAGVLGVIYVIFTEGHTATSGDVLVRQELCNKAIRLGRLLHDLLPDEPEVNGLVALMLLHDARRATRISPAGSLVLLADQNREQWDRVAIGEGIARLERSLRRGRPGPYQIEAAIAAVHAEAPSLETTDWPQIVALYGELARMTPGVVIELNRAVAVGMAAGWPTALATVERLAREQPAVADWHRFHAVKAEILERTGAFAAASSAYQQALELTTSDVERSYLSAKIQSSRERTTKPA